MTNSNVRQIYSEFRDPPVAYRAKPFWSWNGELEEEEIRRQIRVFREMGFGGYFMHSRVGLITRYLGTEWFELIKAGIDEGRKNGMEAWLYDEDRWPSGLAGGLVTRDPRWRNKRLDCLRAPEGKIPADALAVFRFSLDEKGFLTGYERIPPDGVKGEEALVFCVVEGQRSSFYNGYTYLDTLNKEAVRAFIDSTYELYAQYCGDEFGKAVPGVFTDEPNRGHFLGKWKDSENDYQIPWTDSFLDEFQSRMGYDLLDRLPEVFYNMNGESFSRVRYDAAECINQLFIEAFAVQVGQWCEEHGLLLTGHVLHENTLANQLATAGSMARFYEYMQAPGMDILGRAVFYNVPKQVQSVARQCGKKWVLSEMYANNGWDYTLESFKVYGDWQAVLGVNFRCPHLALYTMSGERKRDCPPTISFHQPWWREYRLVEDYFARVNVVISQGEPVCDLLFIHPIDPLTGMISPGWARGLESVDENLNRVEKSFQDLTRWLLGLQVDFDYGDEEMLGRMARVEMQPDGPAIVVGQMSYKRALVPPMPSIRQSTMNLLRSFAEKGGEVTWAGEPSSRVDGSISSEPQELGDSTVVLPMVEESFSDRYRHGRYVSVTDANDVNARDIFAHFRRDDHATWLFLANVNAEKGLEDATVQVSTEGQVQEWDPMSGEHFAVPAKTDGGVTSFTTSFAPGGTRIFVVDREADQAFGKILSKKEADSSLSMRTALVEEERVMPLETEFPVRLDEPNVVPISRARYRLDDEPWSDKLEPVLNIDRIVRRRLGLEPRSTSMIQPWYREAFPDEAGLQSDRSAKLNLAFDFEIEILPEQDIEIALEQADRYTMLVNGTEAPLAAETGWWIEPCLCRFSFSRSLLREGKNEIILETRFDETLDLESAFLLGDFGVRLDGSRIIIGSPVRRLTLGDWTQQGLPFYAGCVRYDMSFPAPKKPASHIVVPDFRGGCVRITEGDRKLGIVAWKPYEIEFAQAFVGQQILGIEVVGHRRNSFGPINKPNSDEYELATIGLMKMPYLSIRKPAV